MKIPMKKILTVFFMLALVVSLLPGLTGCKEKEQEQQTPPVTETETPPVTETETPDTTVVLTVVKGDTTATFTMTEVKALPPTEGWGGVKNSAGTIIGPFTQKGVSLKTLLEDVGGISPGDSVKATAKDGYSVTFSYEQIANGAFTTFDKATGNEATGGTPVAILTYEEDGVALDEKAGPLRFAILTGTDKVSESQWWVKMIEKIEVVTGQKSWELTLEGTVSETLDSAAVEALKTATWTDADGRVWKGVPLWRLVGIVDDTSDGFNDALADAGYEVEVIAGDGYSTVITSDVVKRNDSLIVSYQRDDEAVPEKQWPLRLVGPDLAKSQMVGQIATIKVTLSAAALELLQGGNETGWSLTLEGATTLVLSNTDFDTFAKANPASFTDDDGRVWEGVALWVLLGRVDDDADGFNDGLAETGYEVTITAADGYAKTFTSELIKRNNDLVISYLRDSGELPENQWPLRFVGPGLTKGEMVGQVATITIVFP